MTNTYVPSLDQAPCLGSTPVLLLLSEHLHLDAQLLNSEQRNQSSKGQCADWMCNVQIDCVVLGVGERRRARWLRALVDLTEDPGSILSTHMEAHSHVIPVLVDWMSSSDLSRHQAWIWCTDLKASKTLIHINLNIRKGGMTFCFPSLIWIPVLLSFRSVTEHFEQPLRLRYYTCKTEQVTELIPMWEGLWVFFKTSHLTGSDHLA